MSTEYTSVAKAEEVHATHDREDYAVFLPGKVHGCKDQVAIRYKNNDSSNPEGTWEEGYADYETVLDIYQTVKNEDDPGAGFFEEFSDRGFWYCFDCGRFPELDIEHNEQYDNADWIDGLIGNQYDTMMFIVNWAMNRKLEVSNEG